MNDTYDVAVVGGGPAGTTIATLLARSGRRVCLFERESHPRFHIGESLLPMNLPILRDLGLEEAVGRIGVVKAGADFTPGEGEEVTTFRFSRALGSVPSHAYEVARSAFDEILFRNCAAHGVNALEAREVKRLERGRDGVFELSVADHEGALSSWRARFVVDASGRDCFLASDRGWKRRNRRHASAALFTHYRGVSRRSGGDAGNISIYWFDYGWIWMIPLRDDVMSVGAVCQPDYLKTRSTDSGEFLETTLRLCPEAWARMAGARPVREVSATGNYSYQSREIGGNGILLVGDAYAFVDPVFSSGVYLAMSSAARAVPVVEAWLEGRALRHRLALWKYGRNVNRAIGAFSWFIYRFTTPAMRALFAAPRNLFGVEQAVISMLAGDVYANTSARIRLLAFRVIYGISSVLNPGKSVHRSTERGK